MIFQIPLPWREMENPCLRQAGISPFRVGVKYWFSIILILLFIFPDSHINKCINTKTDYMFRPESTGYWGERTVVENQGKDRQDRIFRTTNYKCQIPVRHTGRQLAEWLYDFLFLISCQRGFLTFNYTIFGKNNAGSKNLF